MAAPTAFIVPVSPPPRPPIQAHDAHWLAVLEANFEQIRRECRRELTSNHPGARHRVAELLAVGANLSAQIEAIEAKS